MATVLRGGYDRIAASGDHNGKEGYGVTAAGAISASATAEIHGVITKADDPDGESTIALPQCPDKIELKLHTTAGNIVKGSRLVQHTDGTFKLDPGTGARVVVAIAQEAKTAEAQLLQARLIVPLIFAS
ncbi:MAG: hypothetical protein V4726_07290 [Verrucomicrobiota bacterium]